MSPSVLTEVDYSRVTLASRGKKCLRSLAGGGRSLLRYSPWLRTGQQQGRPVSLDGKEAARRRNEIVLDKAVKRKPPALRTDAGI